MVGNSPTRASVPPLGTYLATAVAVTPGALWRQGPSGTGCPPPAVPTRARVLSHPSGSAPLAARLHT
eukprot:2581408-Pyramimonas_sp.AAC.1